MNILIMTSAAPPMAPFSTSEKRPPLGVGYLISALKREGHKVYFSDEYLQPSNILDTDFVRSNNIDFVGIYANTICYEMTMMMFEKLQRMRESGKWKGKIVVGGPHTSVGTETIPDYVDHIVIGEGEISFSEIVSGFETGRVVTGKKITDMDSLPLPAWEEFIYKPYNWRDPWIDKYPVYTFNTSRGCPFDCNFCSVQSIWGRSYRFQGAERMVADMEYMIKYYGMQVAYFREDHFTLKRSRVEEFCELLLKKNINTDWMCETRVDKLCDLEHQKLMARAGCKVFYIGVESGSPRMLEFYKKDETVEEFIEAFDYAKKVGIKTYASFIVGAPTETEEEREMTEDLIKRIKPDFISRNVYVGIPGSELYDHVIENELYEYIDPNGTAYLRGHDKLVDRYYNGRESSKIPYPSRIKKREGYTMKRIVRGLLNIALEKVQ